MFYWPDTKRTNKTNKADRDLEDIDDLQEVRSQGPESFENFLPVIVRQVLSFPSCLPFASCLETLISQCLRSDGETGTGPL